MTSSVLLRRTWLFVVFRSSSGFQWEGSRLSRTPLLRPEILCHANFDALGAREFCGIENVMMMTTTAVLPPVLFDVFARDSSDTIRYSSLLLTSYY